jgi:hypothetical protein
MARLIEPPLTAPVAGLKYPVDHVWTRARQEHSLLLLFESRHGIGAPAGDG